MKNIKHILTKYETVKKTEKVEYEIEIPEDIENKTKYANKQILENNYGNFNVIDIINSEMFDEEIIDLKMSKSNC